MIRYIAAADPLAIAYAGLIALGAIALVAYLVAEWRRERRMRKHAAIAERVIGNEWWGRGQ